MKENLPFTMNDNEFKKSQKWRKKHVKNCKEETGPTFTYSFTETGIGIGITISCKCGEKLDVTDYSIW